jgi:hypothetical protein
VVDSLTALETFVFDETNPHKVSFREMLQAIDQNWQGSMAHRKLHGWIRRHPDKFGTKGPRAKANADWLIRLLHEAARSQPHYRGGRYTVGYYTMTSHAGYGTLSRALPSGRQDRETFPSGITPVSWASKWVPEVYHFIADLPHTCMVNGQALNLKYSPPPGGAPPQALEPYLENFAADIETYFNHLGDNKGGLQVQYNIIDRQTLKNSRQDPELFVRVSGYSAYFKDLNPKMQDEIISRAEYDLDTGQLVPDPEPGNGETGQEIPRPKSKFSPLNFLLFWLCVFSRKGISSRISWLNPEFILQQAVDRLLHRDLADEPAEEFLKVLLCCLDICFKIDPEFRENIKNFTGTILFRDRAGDVGVVASFAHEDLDWWEVTFKNGKMRPSFLRRVSEAFGSLFGRESAGSLEPDATLVFKDGKAVLNYLISYVVFNERNFLKTLLDNEIRPIGNMNYLYKFLFMVNHPLLELQGKSRY